MMVVNYTLVLFILQILFNQVLGSSVKKSVSVALNTKWRETPFHLEASEFLNEESPDLFWAYIEGVNALGPGVLQSAMPKEQYEGLINVAQNLISPAKLSLLKFSLALRAHSPAIELFHQIASEKRLPKDCESIVEVNGKYACDIDSLKDLLSTSSQRSPSEMYKADHSFLNSGSSSVKAILYGEIGSPSFIPFHNYLKKEAEKNQLDYLLRHYVWKPPTRKTRLTGYGVELAIKSTEYKAQDDAVVKEEHVAESSSGRPDNEELEGFLFHELKKLYPAKTSNLDEFKSFLVESTKEIPTLKVWEIQELSLQASQKILNTPKEEALRVLRDISENFPSYARLLINIAVGTDMKKEIERNQQMFMQHHSIGPSDAALFFNGLQFDAETLDIFTFLQTLKQETKVLEGLHSVGVPENKISQLLKMDFNTDHENYAIDIRDSAIHYINDLEKDKAYKSWPSSVRDLLRPNFPGMLRNVRKNFFNIIVISDPSKKNARDIIKLVESFYIHRAPVRIGLMFAVDPVATGNDDGGVAMLTAFNFISEDKSPYKGLSFITDIYASVQDQDVSAEQVKKHFQSIYPKADMDDIFGIDSDYDTGRNLTWDFIRRSGIGQPPQVLVNGIILKQEKLTIDAFEDALLTEIMKHTPLLQKSVYKGELTDTDDVLDFLMTQPNVVPRINFRVLSSNPSSFLDLSGKTAQDISISDFMKLPAKDMGSTFSTHLKYLLKNDGDLFRPLTMWVVADLESEEGRLLYNDALTHLKSSSNIRLALVHNPLVSDTTSTNPIGKAVQAALEHLDVAQSKLLIHKLLKTANAQKIQDKESSADEFSLSTMDAQAYKEAIANLDPDLFLLHTAFSKKVLGLQPGEKAIVLNGKVLGPLNSREIFNEDDFNLLEKFSMSLYGKTLTKELKDTSASPEQASDVVMRATSLLLSQPQSKQRYEVQFFGDQYSSITFPASNPSQPAHDLIAILDPVSRNAQKLAPILMVLQKVVNANLKIFLNSVDKHSNMPLKSFYRFVMDEEPQFSGEEDVYDPVAYFSNLPTTPLFTLAMATPEHWMVEPVYSAHDLDNIHLEKVTRGVYADFELEHLILEGHCFEQNTGNPPRGLQFTLGTNSTPVMFDTIVMANLGYFQLKANPGAWALRLRQGRSADIYNIVSQEGTDAPPGATDVIPVINSFRGQAIKLRVTKKPNMQFEDLLQDDSDTEGGLWNSITSTFSGEMKEAEDEDGKINIFSLASGHLYERFLRIMMLSVLKNTKSPVKFWFLKNFLSPTFKELLPFLAQQYNFEYELVQYKWPRWLNQQTEKQRIIWGYKILFLDVLFPLDVKKIIFVDADQVVRADMKELRDLDLGGAPYGYTPFCESRTEMEGYRFWKTGYWASHMGNRKYHISALYVVDLKKFRRIAAGDRLRGQYQGLSQDPNSLSNLDQDLPNNMIHQVGIKSLPQDWLWCETWCDDGSKATAKTIDLCNNPKTKESKLSSAMRIIKEWKSYDDEIKQAIEKYETQKKGAEIVIPKDEEEEVKEGDHVSHIEL